MKWSLIKRTGSDGSLTGRLTVADSLSVNWGRPDSSSGELMTMKTGLTSTDSIPMNFLLQTVWWPLVPRPDFGVSSADSALRTLSSDFFSYFFLPMNIVCTNCLKSKMFFFSWMIFRVHWLKGIELMKQKIFQPHCDLYDLTFAQSWDHYKSFLNFYDLWFLLVKAPGFSSNITQMSWGSTKFRMHFYDVIK